MKLERFGAQLEPSTLDRENRTVVARWYSGAKVPRIDPGTRHARSSRSRARKQSFNDPRAEYKRYYAALRAGKHAQAVAGFRSFSS